MPEEQLHQIAKVYNPLLAKFVSQHNKTHPLGDPLRIHNISKYEDSNHLRNHQGYEIGLSILHQFSAVHLPNPYSMVDGTQEWVDENLLKGSIDYKRSLIESIDDWHMRSTLAGLVEAPSFQIGVCVVGSNTSDQEFEVHPEGKEILKPWFFDCITIVTKGYNPDEKTIDRSTSRLIYLPIYHPYGGVLPDMVYVLGGDVGHFAPHVLAVIGVVLPDGTNAEELTSSEIGANNSGKIFTAHNKILASDRGTDGTVAKVVGETDCTEVLRQLQSEVDKRIRPTLERLLIT